MTINNLEAGSIVTLTFSVTTSQLMISQKGTDRDATQDEMDGGLIQLVIPRWLGLRCRRGCHAIRAAE